jgi:hypothetical protein
MADKPTAVKVRFVGHIPDLMTWDDYDEAHEKRVVRFQLRVTDEGLEIIGDSPYPHLLEALLAQMGVQEIEMMLCG